MENLVNEYIFTKYLHKSGFEQRWLRRINRQTVTQYISDCQRTLTGKKNCFDKQIFYSCATRFKTNKAGNLIKIGRHNRDGEYSVNVVNDFDQLNCDFCLDSFLAEIEIINERVRQENEEDTHYFKSVWLSDPKGDVYNSTVSHIKELFGNIKVLKLSDMSGNIDTTTGGTIIERNAIHYHITVYGRNADTISFEEDKKNKTIVFWKFKDTVVFNLVSGIGTW